MDVKSLVTITLTLIVALPAASAPNSKPRGKGAKKQNLAARDASPGCEYLIDPSGNPMIGVQENHLQDLQDLIAALPSTIDESNHQDVKTKISRALERVRQFVTTTDPEYTKIGGSQFKFPDPIYLVNIAEVTDEQARRFNISGLADEMGKTYSKLSESLKAFDQWVQLLNPNKIQTIQVITPPEEKSGIEGMSKSVNREMVVFDPSVAQDVKGFRKLFRKTARAMGNKMNLYPSEWIDLYDESIGQVAATLSVLDEVVLSAKKTVYKGQVRIIALNSFINEAQQLIQALNQLKLNLDQAIQRGGKDEQQKTHYSLSLVTPIVFQIDALGNLLANLQIQMHIQDGSIADIELLIARNESSSRVWKSLIGNIKTSIALVISKCRLLETGERTAGFVENVAESSLQLHCQSSDAANQFLTTSQVDPVLFLNNLKTIERIRTDLESGVNEFNQRAIENTKATLKVIEMNPARPLLLTDRSAPLPVGQLIEDQTAKQPAGSGKRKWGRGERPEKTEEQY